MANKFSFEIEVIDTGKIKVKQFADTTKKAVEDISKSIGNLARASAEMQGQYAKLSSTFATKKAFEEFETKAKKAEASVAGLGQVIAKIITKLAKWIGLYKLFEEGHSFIKGLTASTSKFEEGLKKLQDRLEKLHTPAKVLEFLKEQQRLAAEQAEQLGPQIELLERLKKTQEALLESVGNRPLLLPGEVRRNMRDWGIEIEKLSKEVDDASQLLMAKIRIMIEAAEEYDEMTSASRELREELEELRQKYEELERKFKDLEKEQSLLLQERIRAEDRATQAIYDGGQALAQLEDRYESNLPIMKAFHKVGGDINQNTEQFANLAAYATDGLSSYEEAVDGARQKQEGLNQTGQQSINVFSGLLDVFGALMGVFSAFGLKIGGAVQRIFGGLSSIQNLVNMVSRLAGGQALAHPTLPVLPASSMGFLPAAALAGGIGFNLPTALAAGVAKYKLKIWVDRIYVFSTCEIY